jgi:DNA-binding transcriptional ArsR family regulator
MVRMGSGHLGIGLVFAITAVFATHLVPGPAAGLIGLLPALALFTRIEEEAVLSHTMRRSIYDTVRVKPGVSPQELVTLHGSSWSTVTYHLRVLERHRLVVAVRDGRYRRYFEAESGQWANGRKHAMATLQNPTTAEIAQIVSLEPGIVQRRIAHRLGLAPSSVNWHVRRLERVALIERRREAGGVRLMPGEAWTGIMHGATGLARTLGIENRLKVYRVDEFERFAIRHR